MKSLKNIILAVVAILVLGSQLYYFLIVNTDMNNQIASNNEEINAINKQIDIANEKLRLLPQTLKELASMDKKKTAILNTVPTQQSATHELIEILSIVNRVSFSGVEIKRDTEVVHQDETGVIIEKPHSITFVSTFSEAKKFVENLNSSYQVTRIQSFSVDNKPQIGEDAAILKLWYGDQFKEVVSTDITFSVFVRPSNRISDEVYDSTFNLFTDTQNAFINLDKKITPVNTSYTDAPIEIPAEAPTAPLGEGATDSRGKFRLDITDSLTSGDTYKFLGPGSDPNRYTGMLSATDTYITVTIREGGYDISMEDESGNIKQNSVITDIKNPNFTIFSQMRQLTSIMPKVHIYIRNYTKGIVQINLDGTLLENINIYNEFDEVVLKGQTKGKVKLT